MVFPAVFNVTAHLNGINAFEIVGGPDTWLGYSVAIVPDINGDGRPELFLGAPADTNTQTGMAYVVFGAAIFPAQLYVASLNGANGFKIVGSAGSNLGRSVSGAGDINSDGFGDLIVGEPEVNSAAGVAHVIFGNSTFPATFYVSSLNGANGFQIPGLTDPPSRTGQSVSNAGDVNGDGRPDLLVGTLDNQAYVIFGAAQFPAVLPTSSLSGTNGFQMIGLWGTAFGSYVSAAGDVNGDGKADLVLGGWLGGQSYLIFGAANFSAQLNLNDTPLNGSNGVLIIGSVGGYLGLSVSSAGDINGDGIQDIILGTYGVPVPLNKAYVIFGAAYFPATLYTSSLNGLSGFRIAGPDGSALGSSVSSIGDMNGDGRNELLVGANAMDQAFVIFSAATFLNTVHTSSLNGSNGLQIVGPAETIFGSAVSGVGDLNGDGKPDFVVGAYAANRVFVVLDAAVPALAPSVFLPVVAPDHGSDLGVGSGIGIGIAISAAVASATIAGFVAYTKFHGMWCFSHSSAAFAGVTADMTELAK